MVTVTLFLTAKKLEVLLAVHPISIELRKGVLEIGAAENIASECKMATNLFLTSSSACLVHRLLMLTYLTLQEVQKH